MFHFWLVGLQFLLFTPKCWTRKLWIELNDWKKKSTFQHHFEILKWNGKKGSTKAGGSRAMLAAMWVWVQQPPWTLWQRWELNWILAVEAEERRREHGQARGWTVVNVRQAFNHQKELWEIKGCKSGAEPDRPLFDLLCRFMFVWVLPLCFFF